MFTLQTNHRNNDYRTTQREKKVDWWQQRSGITAVKVREMGV